MCYRWGPPHYQTRDLEDEKIRTVVLVTCCTHTTGINIFSTEKIWTIIKEKSVEKTTGHEWEKKTRKKKYPKFFSSSSFLCLCLDSVCAVSVVSIFISPACAPLIRDSFWWVCVCVSTSRLLFDRAQVVLFCFFVVVVCERRPARAGKKGINKYVHHHPEKKKGKRYLDKFIPSAVKARLACGKSLLCS